MDKISNGELPIAFQLLDQEKLRDLSYFNGVMDAYNKDVDPNRRGKGRYGRGVDACEALMVFFLQSGDHDRAFVESLFPTPEPSPEMVSLTSPDVTRLAASCSASWPVIMVGESRGLKAVH